MTNYRATTNTGQTQNFAAYTHSDAYQQATDWAGDVGLMSLDEV